MSALHRASRVMTTAAARRGLFIPKGSFLAACDAPLSSPVAQKPQITNEQALRYASSVRRRRGGSSQPVGRSDGEDDNRLARQVAVTDTETFRREADKLLTKLEAALRPMQKHNEVFHLALTPRNHYMNGTLTLELKPEDGMYSFEVNDEACMVHFTSAISGNYNYVLSASTGEWVDEKDGHAMEGMLVRDLIRQCNGLPDL